MIIIFNLYFFLLSQSLFAKDEVWHIKKNEIYTIKSNDLTLNNNQYFLNLKKLILENGSILKLPNFISDKVFNFNISELVVNGRSLIIQDNDARIETPFNFDLLQDPYRNLSLPKAKKGKNGAPTVPLVANQIDNGVNGNDGAFGINGENSLILKLNIGILKLDDLHIVLITKSGGDGGDGGKGQVGGGCRCPDRSSGKGGSGGNGGEGGLPGNINEIEIKWHEISPVITSENNIPLGLSVLAVPGVNGLPGSGGEGAKGGDGKNCIINIKEDGDFGHNGLVGKFNGNNFGTIGKVIILKEYVK